MTDKLAKNKKIFNSMKGDEQINVEFFDKFGECNDALTKSMKHNYAFLDVYKQLHAHVNEHRFSEKMSAGMHLEKITAIL